MGWLVRVRSDIRLGVVDVDLAGHQLDAGQFVSFFDHLPGFDEQLVDDPRNLGLYLHLLSWFYGAGGHCFLYDVREYGFFRFEIIRSPFILLIKVNAQPNSGDEEERSESNEAAFVHSAYFL